MNEDPRGPNAPETTAAPSVERTVPEENRADSSPLVDVMFEQFEFLLTHKNPLCRPDCQECKRLQQVKHWLLTPFQSTRY